MTAESHPLLERLLVKAGGVHGEAPSAETWERLLALVARTYHDSDQDRYTLERSIDISSREMQQLYQDLKRTSEIALSLERSRVAESAAILRATLEATQDAMVVVDNQRRVVAWNQRFVQMANVPDDVMQSRDHGRVLAAVVKGLPDPAAALAEIERIHATEEVSEDEIRMNNGTVLNRYSAPVTLPNGTFVGRVTYFRDVTAERTASERLERARAAAESASHAKSMFLANMSHELRTPLNAVIGLADLLLLDGGDPLTPRQTQYMEGVAQSGRHLLAMVNDVLDLAKIEAGKQELELEPVAPSEAVIEAVGLLQTLATSRGVELVANADDGLPHVKADPLRFRQILYNLISNAVKFTDRGGRVRVTADCEREKPGHVAIHVTDTGIGIAPDDIQRLFRAFEQLNLPSGDRPTGTGLGLALTKRLVDMHGGALDVCSTLGVGSTFTVRFPVA